MATFFFTSCFLLFRETVPTNTNTSWTELTVSVFLRDFIGRSDALIAFFDEGECIFCTVAKRIALNRWKAFSVAAKRFFYPINSYQSASPARTAMRLLLLWIFRMFKLNKMWSSASQLCTQKPLSHQRVIFFDSC